jgi:hypothetical protein
MSLEFVARMNPDNPYAAPQTIELRFPTARLATESVAKRNLFPEISTSQLARLGNYSHSIHIASIWWGVPFFVFIVVGLGALFAEIWQLFFLGFLGFAFAGTRIYFGESRQFKQRPLIILMDGLYFLAIFVAIVFLAKEFLIQPAFGGDYIVAAVLLALLSIIPLASVLATFHARKLFGPRRFLHRDLSQEMDYRKLHRIL